MMKYLALLCFITVSIVDTTLGHVDCTDKDGVQWFGCKAFFLCEHGKGKVFECGPTEAYNQDTKRCAPLDQVPAPCGHLDHKCDVLREGRHALKPDCLWFYTCLGGHYLGASTCNNPPNGPLVFDEEKQLCNWKSEVLKPCGLKEPEPEPEVPDVLEPVDVPVAVDQPVEDEVKPKQENPLDILEDVDGSLEYAIL